MEKTEQGYFFIGQYTKGHDTYPQLTRMAHDGWVYQDSFPVQDGRILVMRRNVAKEEINGKE